MKKLINAMGLTCPQPIVLTKNALENMGNCNILEVYVDNDMAVKNVMKFVKSKNLESSYQQENEKEYHINIVVSEDVKFDDMEENIIKCEPCGNNSNNIVVLSSDQMGEGDSALGGILIKGFIYALTQMENLPKAVILYNGGAKLSIKGSSCLADLKSLEKMGVEILTCGTCLKHYNVEDKLAVGIATNMYTIAEEMFKASNVIKP